MRRSTPGETGSSPPDDGRPRMSRPVGPGRRPYHPGVSGTTDQADAAYESIDPAFEAPRALTNGDLARIFHDIGDMLEVKGELVFKTVAYHRAADVIGRSPVDLVAAYRAGTPPRLPGVGAAISDKLDELAQTGRMAYYERLKTEIPPGL